jgi:hypothetical protein
MECGFTFHHYRDMILLAKKKGYAFSTFRDHTDKNNEKRLILLRHDVDFNLRNALTFAELESKSGIVSTFFIRVHAPFNVFSYDNYPILKKIISLGHEIGLHYEPDFFTLLNEGDDVQTFNRERSVLENIINEKISGISLHEPNRGLWTRPKERLLLKKLKLEYSAYQPKFVKELKYISDSGGKWKEGCFCEFIKKDVPKLCVLTHPVWWFNKSPIENY